MTTVVTKETPPIQSTTPTTWRTLAKTSKPVLVKIVPPWIVVPFQPTFDRRTFLVGRVRGST